MNMKNGLKRRLLVKMAVFLIEITFCKEHSHAYHGPIHIIWIVPFLYGCSTNHPVYQYCWVQENTGRSEATTAEAACRVKGMELIIGTPKETAPNAIHEYVRSCMMASGYRWKRRC